MNTCKLAISICFAFAFLLLSFTVAAQTQNCQNQITSPASGDATTGYPITVKGTANVPPEKHLWVFINPVGMRAWWPQGNGEAMIVNDEWSVLSYLGDGRTGGEFHVTSVIVDDAAHGSLNQWVEEAPENGYPPLKDLPTSVAGCPLDRVLVKKNQ